MTPSSSPIFHSIQTALAGDAEAISELDTQLFPDNCFNSKTIEKEIAVSKAFVRYKAGKLIGYILSRWDGYILDITRIGVHPDFQGRKLGTALLSMVLDDRPAMLHVNKHNQRARQLYQRQGFEVVANTTDSWVMIRPRTSQT
jgi:ribosomal protein S18 acetylase RimI-like enzyme